MLTLVGRYASPFVRRVAVTMQHQGVRYERVVASSLREPQVILAINPVGRVPVLIRDEGRHLVESWAILDYLEEQAPPEKRVYPASGEDRVSALQAVGIVMAALDKGLQITFETSRRPPEKQDPNNAAWLTSQVVAALAQLEALQFDEWIVPPRLTIADISVAVGYRFLHFVIPDSVNSDRCPKLAGLSERCERLDAFRSCPPETF
jgi:glutathione S-transferase